MDERRYTLTDVMVGIYKHKLIARLPEELFTFLIGIIQEHNDVGFKDDFDMTNSSAMAAGGGNNRQSVKRRRDALVKFKIDKKPILKITVGNKGKNTCCKYEIDYDLLCRYNGVWTKESNVPSQKHNSSRDDGSYDGYNDGDARSVTILRSDQKREEQIPPTPQNVSTKHMGSNDNEEGGVFSDKDSGEEEERGTLGNEQKESWGEITVDESPPNALESGKPAMAVSDCTIPKSRGRRPRIKDDNAHPAGHTYSINENSRSYEFADPKFNFFQFIAIQ